MTERQLKAMRLKAKIQKTIYQYLDDNDMHKALRLVNRFNGVNVTAFPGEKFWTYGNMVDSWIEARIFESKC